MAEKQTESHGDRAARVFAEELAQISDPRIRAFVHKCFDTICPNYFWERAASSSGKYHPSFVTGKGGLVRHVKYGCFWLLQLSRAFMGSGLNDDKGPQNLFDAAMAAMIMHDMVKDGDEGRTNGKLPYKSVECHGVELAEAIWLRVMNGNVEFEEQVLILCGVAAHMGVWTKPETFRPWNIEGTLARKIATLVHMADYCSSRKIDDVIPRLAKVDP